MKLQSVEQEWQTFAAAVLKGVPASGTQRREMRRAFYAGAFVMLKNCQRIGDTDITEDEGIQYLDDRVREAEEFCREMIREDAEAN